MASEKRNILSVCPLVPVVDFACSFHCYVEHSSCGSFLVVDDVLFEGPSDHSGVRSQFIFLPRWHTLRATREVAFVTTDTTRTKRREALTACDCFMRREGSHRIEWEDNV